MASASPTFRDHEQRNRWVASQIAACDSKVAYSSRGQAIINGHRWNHNPYRCPICGDWHLTHQTTTTKGN